jgi:hypothetical protein
MNRITLLMQIILLYSIPPAAINKLVSLTGLSIPVGAEYFLKWTFIGNGGSTNGQAIGIDNVSRNCY